MLVYLHGFNSSPASHKAQVIKAYLESSGRGHLYACPKLPDTPREAIRAIEAVVEKSSAGRDPRTVTFIGSSLGGFYATYLAEKLDCRAVLINPAITPHIGLEAYLGVQKNLHTGVPYELTRAHLDGWRELAVDRIDPERYLLLLETGDEVLDWRDAARKYEGARSAIRDGGDHSLQSFAEHIGRILAFAGMSSSA
jgi:predicted esterase YcpF (UPF0227 family)